MYLRLLAPSFLILFFASSAWAWETITLGTADAQEEPTAQTTNLLLTECFHRLQYKLVILSRPNKRSIYEADQGRVDGDFARTEAVACSYPNLVKVPEYIAMESLTAFSPIPDLKIDGWKSILHYHVAWLDGREICNSRLDHASQKTLEANEAALLRFLSAGRAEVGILGLRRGRTLLQRLGIANVTPVLPPLEKVYLYLYLHKKHMELAPKVADMLRTLKKDGTYEAIRNHFFENAPYPRDRLSVARH